MIRKVVNPGTWYRGIIDMRLSLPHAIRLNYLFYAIACGTTYPYLAIYFKEVLHVSDFHLGLMMTIRPLMALLGQPFWSIIADSSGRRSHLAAGLLIVAILIYPVLMAVQAPLIVVVLLVVWAFFNAPINTLSDSITFDYLGTRGRTRFAGFRVFVSTGFVLAVLFIGLLYDKAGITSQFGVYSLFSFLSLVFLWQIPPVQKTPLKQGRLALKELMRERNVILFLIAIFLVETANGMAVTFLSVYCRHLGANNMQTGWIWATATSAEIISMIFFSRVLERLGVKKILVIGFAAVMLKWLLFAFAKVWWQTFPMQLLHAFALTYVYIGAVMFMDMSSHNSIRVTAQAFYTMFILNIASICGSILGGRISQQFGYATMYLGASLVALLGVFIMLAFVRNPAYKESAGSPALRKEEENKFTQNLILKV